MTIRDITPKRRLTPTKKLNGNNWAQHKPNLREDFNNQCAYCGSYDGYRHTYFEVDHFIPKDFLKKCNSSIGLCQYSNLVYSCKFCNNNKSSKWPSNSETLFHLNNEGFIDPCDNEYDKHLYRTPDGSIMWHTPLGKWMATIAFKFDERQYSIKLLWELNERRKLVVALASELGKRREGSIEYKEIKIHADKLSFEYVLLHSELMDYYNSI